MGRPRGMHWSPCVYAWILVGHGWICGLLRAVRSGLRRDVGRLGIFAGQGLRRSSRCCSLSCPSGSSRGSLYCLQHRAELCLEREITRIGYDGGPVTGRSVGRRHRGPSWRALHMPRGREWAARECSREGEEGACKTSCATALDASSCPFVRSFLAHPRCCSGDGEANGNDDYNDDDGDGHGLYSDGNDERGGLCEDGSRMALSSPAAALGGLIRRPAHVSAGGWLDRAELRERHRWNDGVRELSRSGVRGDGSSTAAAGGGQQGRGQEGRRCRPSQKGRGEL